MVAKHDVDLRHLVGSLHAHEAGLHRRGEPPRPFITISREAGTGGIVFGQALAERLNRMAHKSAEDSQELPLPWRCFDRELVERIANDHHLSAELIESLEHSSHSWVEEFFRSVGLRDHDLPEAAIVRRVGQTIRALAQQGHVILVGRGGVFITRDMPAGLHIRLVAPLAHRIRFMAELRKVSLEQAETMVRALDAERSTFFRRYWPTQPMTPELFHITLNAAKMNDEQMIDCVLPLLKPMLTHTPVLAV